MDVCLCQRSGAGASRTGTSLSSTLRQPPLTWSATDDNAAASASRRSCNSVSAVSPSAVSRSAIVHGESSREAPAKHDSLRWNQFQQLALKAALLAPKCRAARR
jgi:hypothetical protein